ncbi:MAG: iron ABC transporter permease, partial [Thermoleophilia bacterium]|nr:iron ABC transporter permease [Thermoleophilia bacterium]
MGLPLCRFAAAIWILPPAALQVHQGRGCTQDDVLMTDSWGEAERDTPEVPEVALRGPAGGRNRWSAVFRCAAKALPTRVTLIKLRPAFLVVLPVLAFFLSLALGRYQVSLAELLQLLGAKLGLTDAHVAGSVETVILHVRLPRVVAGMLIGAGLSLAGASYQGMFRNPLVSPDILGASAGAGFGAALGIMLSQSVVATQILALLFGLAAVLITYALAGRLRRGDPTLFLVLTGILVGTVFTALLSLLKVLADPYDKLPAITFWLMGSLAAVNLQDILILLGPMVVGAGALLAVRWHLNPLSFGEEEAQAMGAE